MNALTRAEVRQLELDSANRLRARRRNDPPWGKPMSATEFVDAQEAWTRRLIGGYGYVSAQNDDKRYDPQCGGCRFYMPIGGASGSDWGACGNPSSDRVGVVVFEHHGCPMHSEGDA